MSRQTRARRTPAVLRGAWLALSLLLITVLTACVSVPIEGPVTKAGGEAPGCLECVDVDVSSPSPGAEPKQIVDGYLRAMSNYQPNYSVAREYLTSTSAQSWVPEEGTSIYTGTSTVTSSDAVVLEGRLVASLDSHRTFTSRDESLRQGFTLVQDNGEWRISDPPKGLLVAQYSFDQFYRPFSVYFVGNGKTLVPDPIYLPPRVNEATVLVQALLGGASAWLKPSVTSAVPDDTTLQVSVTVKDEVADVALSESVLPLSNDQRALMAAQIFSTLDPVAGVAKVRLLVGQQPYSVPGADPDDFTISRDALSGDLTPIPSNAAEAYYGVTKKGVVLIDASSESLTSGPAPGPLGTRDDVEHLAVSVTNTTLAAVTDGGTVLREASGDKIQTILTDVTGLLRPQYSRYDELWAVGREGGKQKMWAHGGAATVQVGGSVVDGGEITAFKVSPDGARMALIRVANGRPELGVARITRSDGFSVDDWRPISGPATADNRVTKLVDLAWSDATTLVVLAATTENRQVQPYRVSQDASTASSMGTPDGDARQVAVSLKNPLNIVLVGDGGRTWRDDGSQRWSPFVDKLTAFAFPD